MSAHGRSCDPLIEDPFAFPRQPENRPALGKIGYRVGVYVDFREALMRNINDAAELRAWTHRAPDDPGIALLEGAAVLGDILTFYQEHYANEAFLRTASWRESIASLTRLLGYRLAPGLGGRATFAFEVKGSAPVQIPAGLPLKADLAQVPDPVDFQTDEDLTAYPHLSRMHLYPSRAYGAALLAGASTIEIADVGGVLAPSALDSLDLKQGDRLMLVAPEPPWALSGDVTLAGVQQLPQIIDVAGVKRALGRTVVTLKSPLAASWQRPVTAYRLGRTFHHFGHAAPATFTSSRKSGNEVVGTDEQSTQYWRHVQIGPDMCYHLTGSLFVGGDDLPLDREIDGLLVGGRVVIQTRIRSVLAASPGYQLITVAKTIKAVEVEHIAFGSLSGFSTRLKLDSPLFRNGGNSEWGGDWPASDVRRYLIHEVTSPPINLLPVAMQGAPTKSGDPVLCFFGTRAQAPKLAGRRLVLQHNDGRSAELRCTNTPADFSQRANYVGEERLWKLALDGALPFIGGDFGETAPRVTVFGNVTDASQGKAEAEAVLGNGDGGARFQTFKIAKAPLTYLLSSNATPAQVPEVGVFVDGRRWTCVDSLFGRAATDEVYIVREDADGASYVQFGDGETGARLPSGVDNVTARYRTGSGAYGLGKPGADPSAGRRIQGLDKVTLAGIVSGGADPEPGERARRAAPGRVQSLGRLVSVQDFETETRTIPGVTTATVAWALLDGVPSLRLSILLESGREGEFVAIRKTIQSYGRERGADRVTVHVQQAFLRYVWLRLSYACDPRLQAATVEAQLRTALGLAGDDAAAGTGLFGRRNRRLGASEYATRIEAVCQQVDGVIWCEATGLAMFASHADPAIATAPAGPLAVIAQLVPNSNELLALAGQHLTLSGASATSDAVST